MINRRRLISDPWTPEQLAKSQQEDIELVPQTMAAYRASEHLATGFSVSPDKIVLGRECRTPIDLVLGIPGDTDAVFSHDKYVQPRQEQMIYCYAAMREQPGVSAQRRKRAYDKTVSDQSTVNQEIRDANHYDSIDTEANPPHEDRDQDAEVIDNNRPRRKTRKTPRFDDFICSTHNRGSKVVRKSWPPQTPTPRPCIHCQAGR